MINNIHTEGRDQMNNPENRVSNRAVFTGEALFTVEAVNPNKEQIIEIRGLEAIADRIEEPEYQDILLKSTPYTKIDFLLSFEPNKLLGVEDKYAEKMFVNYPVFINSELSLNKSQTKVQVIDDHNQSAWVDYEDGITPTEALTKTIENSTGNTDYLTALDTKTLRFALTGEVLLYSFIFNMTTLPRHSPDKGQVLAGFVLGDDPTKGTETFKSIVNGNFEPVREILNSDICRYTDGKVAKIGGFLGVRVNNSNPDNVRFYQEIFSHPMEVGTFRESYTSGQVKNGHTTRLSSGAFSRLTDSKYGWKHEWNNSTKFQEYDTSTYQMPVNEERGETVVKKADLPF